MEKGKEYRSGNFLAGKREGEKGESYIYVREISGGWSVEFAYTQVMYAYLDRLKDDEMDVIATMACVWMGATCILDAEFLRKTMGLLWECIGKKADTSVSSDEDIRNEEIMADMEERLKEETDELHEGEKD